MAQPQPLRDYWRGYHSAEYLVCEYGINYVRHGYWYGEFGNGSNAYVSGFSDYLRKHYLRRH